MTEPASKLRKIIGKNSKYRSLIKGIVYVVLIITVIPVSSFVQPKQAKEKEYILSNPR